MKIGEREVAIELERWRLCWPPPYLALLKGEDNDEKDEKED